MGNRRHLAWASSCCGIRAFVAPLDVSAHETADNVCRVVCTAPPIYDVCISKSALWCYDATSVYQAFAREEALRVAHLWDPPPVVLQYLRTGNESIRDAARDAARAAAWAATRAAAGAAAWAAAGATARAAAGDARAAAWAAAQDTARAAAGDSARKRQNHRLAKLLTNGHRLYGQRVVP